MLVTLLVLYYVRPVLRCRTRRRKALSLLLVAASLATNHGRLQPAQGQDRFDEMRFEVPSATEPELREYGGGKETSSIGGQRKLREGTVIPPTIGRVVNLGRRWAFIPTEDEMPARRDLTARVLPTDESPLLRKWNGSSRIGLAQGDHPDAVSNRTLPIVLCENQMLERIVESMRTDATDDRWEISGEILEFFDENRLLIRTIQRANSN